MLVIIIMSFVARHLAIHLTPCTHASHIPCGQSSFEPSHLSSLNLRHLVFFFLLILHQTPRMLTHSLNPDPPLHISVEHLADQINALLAHNVGYSQIVVHDLVDTVERVLLVDDGVEQDA